MKKSIAFILIIASFVVCACTLKNEGQYDTQFDEGSNQTISFNGVTMSIPFEWKESNATKSDDERCFEELDNSKAEYSPLNLLYLTVYNEIESLTDGMDSIECLFPESEGYEITSREDLIIDGCESKNLTVQKKGKDGDVFFKQTLIEKEKHLVLISFTCKNEYALYDYDKVIDSIVVE